MSTPTIQAAYQVLLDYLESGGWMLEGWRSAFEAAPRAAFVPDLAWALTNNGTQSVINRDADPDGWTTAVCSDIPIVTQYDDGATTPGGPAGRTPSSSCSAPSIVAMMLTQLDAEPGHRVLEIGTGTGWNAGLLATRTGDGNVVTVEVDEHVADRARRALAAAGFWPTVVAGDGAGGYKPAAPYDRIICTAAVRTLPYAWIEQATAGAVIVTPWRTVFDYGALLRLTVGGDGTAVGGFVDDTISFMALRAERLPDEEVPTDGPTSESMTALDPRLPVAAGGAFAAGLRVGHCEWWTEDDLLRLDDTESRSWAAVELVERGDGHRVRQAGPRRLWDEVEAAYRWWDGAGRPEYTEFDVVVGPEGQQVRLGNEVVSATPVR